MYDEPYRWIEAVANRRQYLDDQFIHGSPLVGISCAQGVLLLTFNRGTEKIYEIYDRIALGGMGHPADLEKLRFTLLDMAHVEGFQRSPSDVTASRLLKNGLAPVIKPAFEEIMRAPYIVKILLVELGTSQDRDHLFTMDYDGMFAEQREFGVLSASSSSGDRLSAEWKSFGVVASLSSALEIGLRLWGVASLLQDSSTSPEVKIEEKDKPSSTSPSETPEEAEVTTRIREMLANETLECVLLDRESGKMETYRSLGQSDLQPLIPTEFQPAT